MQNSGEGVRSVIRWLLLAAGAWLASSAAAQNVAPIEVGRITRPQLVIAAPGDVPVRLQQVAVHAEVSGNLAITEIALTFHNPNRRVLEGELQFPLLDGQNVLGFALDVNGRMREAVPVDKARGQAVFEDITRGRVDPGLLQITQGNNFKLRVYPIPAQGTRQVLIRYAETLKKRAGRLIYRLPLEYADTLDSFRLDLNVAGAPAAPQKTRGELTGLDFKAAANGYHAEVTRERYAGRGLLELDIPPARGAQAYTQNYEGKTYFYADVPVPAREAPRALPHLVGLIWDSSGSGVARDHVREFALLDAYFRRMQNGEVRLTRIRDTAEAAQSFNVVNGDWRALRAALESTVYDGATNLGAFAAQPGIAEYLLFSDGLSNFGARPLAATRVPLYAVSAATKSDAVMLAHVAEDSGGRFIDLIADSAPEAARKLLNAATRITAVSADGARDVVMHSPYPRQGRIEVAGQMTESATRLQLTIAHPGAKPVTLDVPVRAGAAPFMLVAPLWARFKIDALEALYDLNRAEIRRLGRAFRLVTRETSLIVLERVDDYVRYEISPPPELAAEYERLRVNFAQRRNADRTAHLENIMRRFQDKITWWNRDFPQGDKPAPQPALRPAESVSGAMMDRREDVARNQAAPAAAAPPAARPEPKSALRMAERDALSSTTGLRKSRDDTGASGNTATIQLKKWEPDAPYAARMRVAATENVYRVYLDERPGYLNSTAFFLDAADILFDKKQSALALRVLTNLAEMDLENRHILRILGHRLLQAHEAALAIPVFRKVLELSPEEPQSYRDLGLALAADRQFQAAIDTLYEVVVKPWHGRFPDVEIITLAELNAIIATSGEKLDVSRIDPRLVKNLPLDLRVVLTWDADNTDIDLWVTDPNGEKAFYGRQLTYQGGRMSLDFTGGYGPEEFSLKRAKPGKYKVEAQYFGDRRQNVTGPTTLQVKLATHFGTVEQKEQSVTLRLKGRQETVFVGEFEIK
jgi:Ca-activated chloride channel family protein